MEVRQLYCCDLASPRLPAYHTTLEHSYRPTKHLKLIQLCQPSTTLCTYRSGFSSMHRVSRSYPGPASLSLRPSRPTAMKPTYGLSLDRWGSASESGALGHCLTLSALHTPTESCVVSHLRADHQTDEPIELSTCPFRFTLFNKCSSCLFPVFAVEGGGKRLQSSLRNIFERHVFHLIHKITCAF